VFTAAAVLCLMLYIDVRRMGRSRIMPRALGPETNKFLAQGIAVFLPAVTVVFPENIRMQTEQKLKWAGLEGRTALEFLATKLFFAAAAAAVGSMLAAVLGLDFLWVAGAVFFGYIAPDMFLDRKIRARQKSLAKDMPDFGMFFATAVEAGGGDIYMALSLAAQKFGGEIGKEVATAAQQISIGKRRTDALQEMADRCGIEEMSRLVDAICQAIKFGTPVSDAVKAYSAEVRLLRRFEAEKKAGEVVVQMVFPMLLFIVMPLLVMLAYPALMQIRRALVG